MALYAVFECEEYLGHPSQPVVMYITLSGKSALRNFTPVQIDEI